MVVLLTRKFFISTYENKKLGVHYSKKHAYLFPIRPSTTLAGIIADITGDGHLGHGLIQFTAKDKKEVLRFRREFCKIFRHKCSIRKSSTFQNTWECLVGSNTLHRIFKLLGTPYGNKTNTKFTVPEWVKNGEDDIRRRYLQRLFECEGSVRLQRGNRIVIKIAFYKNERLRNNLEEFLLEIKSMLLSFGIKTTNLTRDGLHLRKDGSRSIGLAFEIHGTAKNTYSMDNFYKKVNFESSIKREKLKMYLSGLKKAPLS